VDFNSQPTLAGPTLTLTPATPADWAALFAVAADPLVWEVHPSSDRWQEPVFQAFFDDGLASGGMLVVRERATNRVIGSSRYSSEFTEPGEVEIGWTFLGRDHWGGATNREMKHLMLTHAFETLGCNIVGWRTDNFNHASQRAIERLGARKDGVLRGHALRRDGTIRDTVMYSLAAGEWPEVKAQLLYLLDKPRT